MYYIDKFFISTYEWKYYLKVASNLYKYKFAESLLIYAQNPNATACATLEQWDSIGRWVKKGSTSMKIIDDTEGDISLKYVFDLKVQQEHTLLFLKSGKLDTLSRL